MQRRGSGVEKQKTGLVFQNVNCCRVSLAGAANSTKRIQCGSLAN
jgi:hypothetical protein